MTDDVWSKRPAANGSVTWIGPPPGPSPACGQLVGEVWEDAANCSDHWWNGTEWVDHYVDPLVVFLTARLDEESRRASGAPGWVKAARLIIAAYESEDNYERYGGCQDECEWKALEYALAAHAQAYSDHSDFRAEWLLKDTQ